MNIELPTATPTDPSDVVLALETANALWRSGESRDALKWLRRAAESAEAEGDDMRALSLARAAAELTDLLPADQASQPPPPSVRPSSSFQKNTQPSAAYLAEQAQAAQQAVQAAQPAPVARVASAPPPLPGTAAEAAPEPAPQASAPPPSSPKASAAPPSSPKAAPPPASKPSVAPASTPITSHPMRSLEPAPTPISSLATASRPPPPPNDGPSPQEAITPVPAAQEASLRAAQEAGLRASSLARPFESAPAAAPFPPQRPAESPALAQVGGEDLASSARQALRVVVEVLSRDSGTFLVRIIEEGDAPPSRGHEALLVPLVPGIDLRAT